jgi:pimeloyl-ACP methyl ester carboxylesterase
MKLLILIVTGLASLWILWVLLTVASQQSILYPGARFREAPGGPPPVPDLEVHWLTVGQDAVEAWLLPAMDAPGPSPVVLLFHGNGELIDDWPYAVQGLCRRGFAVLLVEYPGYGRSGGRPHQTTITETAIRAWDLVQARPDLDGTRIIAYGRSLGGGAACALTRERSVAALVLSSAFRSVRVLAARRLVPGFAVSQPFDNVAAVRAFAGPILVVHGREDRQIDVSHGRALAGAGRNARLILYDAGHNGCPPDLEAHWADVAALLEDQAPTRR